ncbi:MAG: hypothetical protein KA715_00260 [Xanthomonadaceae bacterium]|nr:hypothetical protein [Xanthomonadaceae bacterium]
MNNEVQKIKTQITKYNILTGHLVGGSLQNPMHAGVAIHYEGDSYYLVRLNLFPRTWFYLSKNQESQNSYTVFTKKLEDCGSGVRLQNPVGKATLHQYHIEISIPLLSKNLFLEIFPASNSLE